MWTSEYEDNIDSYLKPIDYFDFFNFDWVLLDKFIKNVFIDDIVNVENLYWPLKEFLEWLFKYYPSDMNIRKLKLILRKANQNHVVMYWKHDSIFELDWRLNILFEASKYIGKNDTYNSLFDKYKKSWRIVDSTIIWAYIYNLVSFTNWNKERYYWGRNNSLFEWEKMIITKTPLKIWEKWDQDILLWQFNLWELEHIIVHKKYLDY